MIRLKLILWALMSIPLLVSADDNCDKAKEYYREGVKLLAFEKRKVAFEKAVKLCPTYAEAHVNLADAYENLGEFEQAEKYYKKAITIKPDLFVAIIGLGDVYLKSARYKDSYDAFVKASEIKPDNELLRASLKVAAQRMDLVKKAPDLSEKGAGLILLDHAIKNRNLASAKLLLEKGVDPRTTQEERLSWWEMGSPLATAAFIGDLPMALLLIEKGAVVDLGPLRFAIRGRRLDIVRVLLDSGGTVHKNTALLEAARHGYIDGLSLLLEKGADPNAGINEGKATDSALRAAVSSGSLEAVQTLLEKGADPNYGAPLVEAAQRGRMDMVGLLRAKRADEDCLRKTIPWLIQTGKVEEVRKILEEGVQVDKEQALDTAASYGRARIAEILVEGGADVKKGAPLVWAASSGNMETVNFFLNKGVDIHKKDQFDRTALRCADSGGFKKIKELLIERGAKE